MGLFFGILSFENGFVLISDIMPDRADASSVIKINERIVIALANDLEYGKKFCEEYIIDSVKETDGITEIIALANNAFQRLSKEYVGKILTLHFAGYNSGFQQKLFHSILFNGSEIIYNSPAPSNQKTLFTFEVNLGTFIVNRAYSNYMSVQDAINLMGYVSTQYRILYPDDIGRSFTMFVVSESGVRSLSDEEIQEVLDTCEKMDMKIRRDCSDFFLTNESGAKK